MKTRSLEIQDIPALAELHQQFYAELVLPDFKRGLCSFVIEDETPICFGTVQTFVELSILTDKSKSKRVRREALYRTLDIASYVSRQHGFENVHVFTREDNYAKVLTKRGFEPVKGHSLVIGI